MHHQKPILAGHPFTPIGRGEDIRCSFRALRTAGLILPIRDIYSYEKQLDPEIEKELKGHLISEMSSTINIFYINGNEVEQVLAHIGALPPDTYNIISPQWELGIYPEEWSDELNRFDEIWAPSKFVYNCINKKTSKPIFHMPLPVTVQLSTFLGRRFFQIPESSYTFLFFFDFRSYIERKNPLAVIKAFQKVCEERPNEDVRLIIKINRPPNSYDNEAKWFFEIVNKCPFSDRIIIIDRVFTDNEVKNLIRCCDCFVSLHRSEGFGRGMAEAMFLGKPVIATGYSGNLDFMNNENSCLITYDLIDVKEGCYPHAKGQVWAEPDIENAVHYMLKLLDDRDYGRKIGQIASRHIRTYFSYRAIGLKYRERIDEIFRVKGMV